MTSLVQASREFEMLTKVIDAFSQVELRVAQTVAQK
jgi:flagellar basal body rod protein FlgG